MRATIVFACALISSSGLAVAQTAKPRLAIKTFENPANHHNSNVGNALTEILTTELAKTGKYRLIERQAAEDLLRELNFASSGAADNRTFAQKGNLLGAEYFLLGKVTNFNYQETATEVAVPEYPGQRIQTVYIQQADVRLDFRLVSTKTGEIVLSEAGTAQNSNRSIRSELLIWNRCLREGFSFTTSEMSNSLIGRTSVEAVAKLARKLNDLAGQIGSYTSVDVAAAAVAELAAAEGNVLGLVTESEFIISLGSKAGLLKGDRLTVYAESPIRNKKGEVIYRERREVAKVEVFDMDASGERAKVRQIGQATDAVLEGYSLKVDPEWAAALRGAGKAASPSVSAPTTPGIPAPGTLETIVKKGDRYFEDKYYAQALEQYQKALEFLPDNFQLLDKLASAHLFLGNFLETEDVCERILRLDYDVIVPVAHRHFSDCEGTVKLRRGRLIFQGQKRDHNFAVSRSELKGIRMFDDTGWLEFTVRMGDGKDRKFDLLPLLFAERQRAQLNTLEHNVRQGQIEDHKKFLRMFLRLIQKYL